MDALSHEQMLLDVILGAKSKTGKKNSKSTMGKKNSKSTMKSKNGKKGKGQSKDKKKKKKKKKRKETKVKALELTIGIIGCGCVGSAIYEGLLAKEVAPQKLYRYDKYKNIGSLQSVLEAQVLFLCLPTLYDEQTGEYDKVPIEETCMLLSKYDYRGVVVIKSTVEPQTTSTLSTEFPSLTLMHNPEFLSARSATQDFIRQKHVMVGIPAGVKRKDVKEVLQLYKGLWPKARLSVCSSDESEAAKLFCNNFYAQKIMIFNEFYLLCTKLDINFREVTNLMLMNDWINPMHTQVPGTDGSLGFGGACFPKDTRALLSVYKSAGTPHQVLLSVVQENSELR